MPLRLIAALCLAMLPYLAARAEDAPARTAFPEDDFTLSEYRIPMRDGVELYTLVLTPKGAAGPLPVLLERTPYDASDVFGSRATTQLAVMRGPYFAGKGFIYVFQDIRGRFRSAGKYAMYRVPRGALQLHAFWSFEWADGYVAAAPGAPAAASGKTVRDLS